MSAIQATLISAMSAIQMTISGPIIPIVIVYKHYAQLIEYMFCFTVILMCLCQKCGNIHCKNYCILNCCVCVNKYMFIFFIIFVLLVYSIISKYMC